MLNNPNKLLIRNCFGLDAINIELTCDLIEPLLNKYPFLELTIKWNCPMLSFGDKNVAFFITKKELEGKKFKSPNLFIGIPHGNIMFKQKLFENTKHAQVRYINATKKQKTLKNIDFIESFAQFIEL
jgi:hypothetical protein